MQRPLIDNLPFDSVAEEPKINNCLQDMLLSLMNDKGCTLADIQKETDIPWGTLYAWYRGEVRAQLLDQNVLTLAKYFNVTLEYLAFGIGED